MAGTEYRGDARGLTGLPQVAAEVQREISVACRFPIMSVGSKTQAGLLILQHQSWKEMQMTSSCEKQQGFCLAGRDSWRLREPLNGPMHTISFAATYPGL